MNAPTLLSSDLSTLPASMATVVDISELALFMGASDFYLRRGEKLVMRQKGKLAFDSDKWSTTKLTPLLDDKTVVVPAAFDKLLAEIKPEGTGNSSDIFTRVYVAGKVQVRINFSKHIAPPTMHVRVTPRVPFTIEAYLKDLPQLKSALQEAKGLIVVCGPIGGGKTSLASAIVQHWCQVKTDSPRHVMCIADPIEYFPQDNAIVSTVNCALTSAGASAGLPHLAEIVPTILRSDIDALYIGEIRDAETLRIAMEFSSTNEPVITTLHAGSVGDCIIRMLAMAENAMSPETARLVLASCLVGICYIHVTHNSKGEAVPAIEYLSCQEPGVRSAIVKGNPQDISTAVDTALTNGTGAGATTRSKVMDVLRGRGLSSSEISAALGKLNQQKR